MGIINPCGGSIAALTIFVNLLRSKSDPCQDLGCETGGPKDGAFSQYIDQPEGVTQSLEVLMKRNAMIAQGLHIGSLGLSIKWLDQGRISSDSVSLKFSILYSVTT